MKQKPTSIFRKDVLVKTAEELYALRGDPAREHTLVFCGTPEEFAFFKARLCEWARKRIRP